MGVVVLGISFALGACGLAALAHFIQKRSPMGLKKYEKVDAGEMAQLTAAE
jgi:hypothetical protein